MKGTVIRENLTTNSQGKISVSNLRPGDYQFVETKAPKHYDLNKEPIPFTIEKGQAEPISVTAKNSLTKGAVELSKVEMQKVKFLFLIYILETINLLKQQLLSTIN